MEQQNLDLNVNNFDLLQFYNFIIIHLIILIKLPYLLLFHLLVVFSYHVNLMMQQNHLTIFKVMLLLEYRELIMLVIFNYVLKMYLELIFRLIFLSFYLILFILLHEYYQTIYDLVLFFHQMMACQIIKLIQLFYRFNLFLPFIYTFIMF